MTKEEKLKAFEMRLDGCTYEKIGRAFGISKQAVSQAFGNVGVEKRKQRDFVCKYPNIKAWIKKNEMNCITFSEKIGFAYASVYQWFHGDRHPSKEAIDAILAVTGMTYEEAFMEGRADAE